MKIFLTYNVNKPHSIKINNAKARKSAFVPKVTMHLKIARQNITAMACTVKNHKSKGFLDLR